MAGIDYAKLQAKVSKLMPKVKQGSIQLKRVTTTPGANPWDPPVVGVPVLYELDAVARRMHQRYENGVLIVETGDMVTFAVPEVVPLITDKIVMDGADRAITNLTPIPAAGTPAAWKAWCAA